MGLTVRAVPQSRSSLNFSYGHASCRSNPRRFFNPYPRQFLAAHQGNPRPQLPFLYPSSQHFVNGQLSRLFSISSNSKRFIKETARLSVRYTVLIFLLTSCFSIASLGILSERQERAFPSPHEWSLITRFRFRRGKWWQVPENNQEEGFTNWARVYSELQYALDRLEDLRKDGVDLREQEEEGIQSPGVKKISYDLTAKSGEWRQGYYEVLMGMASAAERLDGWVTTKSRRNVWASEFVKSPSNPRPKAVHPGMPELPDEKDRVPAAESPEIFYLKIITSKGFSTHQRLSAALGYADWLSFRKSLDSAEEMYRQALDIAISGLSTTDISTVIDRQTGTLFDTAPANHITPNIVCAATNLGLFMAHQGRTTSALPIFISLLRARLRAEEAHSPVPVHRDSTLVGTILTLLKEPAYPPLPPSGNEPLLRRETDRCEEAALKTYIGEILFATAESSAEQRQEGLSWVRDSVTTSKSAQYLKSIRSESGLRKKCEQCEEIGLESWGKILTYLVAEAREKRNVADPSHLMSFMWKSREREQISDVEALEDEEEGVVMRLGKLRNKMLQDEYAEMDRKYSRTFVF